MSTTEMTFSLLCARLICSILGRVPICLCGTMVCLHFVGGVYSWCQNARKWSKPSLGMERDDYQQAKWRVLQGNANTAKAAGSIWHVRQSLTPLVSCQVHRATGLIVITRLHWWTMNMYRYGASSPGPGGFANLRCCVLRIMGELVQLDLTPFRR